jgi:hypothetical protein
MALAEKRFFFRGFCVESHQACSCLYSCEVSGEAVWDHNDEVLAAFGFISVSWSHKCTRGKRGREAPRYSVEGKKKHTNNKFLNTMQ